MKKMRWERVKEVIYCLYDMWSSLISERSFIQNHTYSTKRVCRQHIHCSFSKSTVHSSISKIHSPTKHTFNFLFDLMSVLIDSDAASSWNPVQIRVHRFVFRWNPAVGRKRNSVPEFRWISANFGGFRTKFVEFWIWKRNIPKNTEISNPGN